MQLAFGLAAFVLQLPFSLRKDFRRIKQLRYGRRLKGPVLVNAKDFTKAVGGDGIGITTNDSKLPLRIPRDAENKHFLIVGDTGSGKSSIIRQMLYQVDARGDIAIVYDPACEFVKQFYNEHRGDIVLNPLDARMPYWNPSNELRRKAEAKALAVSLYQPEGVSNRFFVEAPQKIFAHLLTFLPTPEQLVQWMSNPARSVHQRNWREGAGYPFPIASRLQVLINDKRAVFTAAAHAQRAADYLNQKAASRVSKASAGTVPGT